MSDYELVYMAQEHIEEAREALYVKYSKYLNALVFKFYEKNEFNRLDIEDIKLECMLVFEKVIDSYNQDKDSKFSTYLRTCLDTKLTDMLRRVSCNKNNHNSTALSFYDEFNGVKINDFSYNNKDLVENIIINDYIDVEKVVENMKIGFSKLELNVLQLLVKGYSQKQVAIKLNIDIKKVYNTVYRLKIKFREILENDGGI